MNLSVPLLVASALSISAILVCPFFFDFNANSDPGLHNAAAGTGEDRGSTLLDSFGPDSTKEQRSQLPDELDPDVSSDTQEPQPKEKNWTDSELGLDFDRPFEEIPIADYFLAFDQKSLEMDLTKGQSVARYNRIARFYHENEDYWQARVGVDSLQRGLRALRNLKVTDSDLIRDVGVSVNYAKYWAYKTAGKLVDEDQARNQGLGETGGVLMLSGATAWFVIRNGEFSVFDEWQTYRAENQHLDSASKNNERANIDPALRQALISEFESALAWQLSVLPDSPKLLTRANTR